MKTSNHTLLPLAACAAFAALASSAHAAKVLFVDNETPSSSWSALITGGGHTFTLFDTGTYNLSLNNQARIDYVNSFDAIVMSGSNPVFNAVRSFGARWNTLPTPMINLGNYLISGQFSAGSWQWTTPTTGTAPNASGTVAVLDAADRIWTGVTITPGSPETAALFTGNVGHLDLGTDSPLPGITAVAAQSSSTLRIAIAHAAPGAVRAGSQEQYFIAGMVGGNNNPVTHTAEGQQAFLNAIASLTGGFAAGPLLLKISQSGGTLDFEWNSHGGMQYDLLSSPDLTTAPETWPVYNDGVTTYENIRMRQAWVKCWCNHKRASSNSCALCPRPCPPELSKVCAHAAATRWFSNRGTAS